MSDEVETPKPTIPSKTQRVENAPTAVLEYKGNDGKGVRLLDNGTVEGIGHELDDTNREIYSVILTQFVLLSNIQSVVQEGIKQSNLGRLHLFTTGDERLIESVEMLSERLRQTNRSFVMDSRRREGRPAQQG